MYTCSGGQNCHIFRDQRFGIPQPTIKRIPPSKRSYQQLLKVQSRLLLSGYRSYRNAVLCLSAGKSRVTVRKQLTNWHFQNISEHRNTAPSDHRGLGTTVVLASTSMSVKTTITPLKEIKNRKSLHVQLYYKATTTRGLPSNYVRQWAGSTMLSYFLIFCNAVEMRLFGFKFIGVQRSNDLEYRTN